MSWIPNTDADRTAMLSAIGAGDVAELFSDVPAEHRFPALALPDPLSEPELMAEMRALAARNAASADGPCFLGAGAYRHFIPAAVSFIAARSEFVTAYTPYQPEISQGTLQAIFEYQSLISRLTGMDASNASHYDGATATAEAVLMALRVHQGKRRKVRLSRTLHPQYREVVRTYLQGMDVEIRDADAADGDTACLVVQNPDFLGRIRAPDAMGDLAAGTHAAGALFLVAANPIALGLLEPPGSYGADVTVGEGQALGGGLCFGGPYLGFFAFRRELIRRSSGRIAGETVDRDGRRGFVFTLNTREQHIRRERATSNICTNESLNALTAAAYLSCLGRGGLRAVAELCWHKAHYAARLLSALPGFSVVEGPFFHEFALRCPVPVSVLNRRLREDHGILGGYDLGGEYPELAGHMLLCCTELTSRADVDLLASALKEASHGH